ncbi:MAG: polysulfide reductase NrfD [Anaerolineae bacterium]|jgi:molybdopterin-containing oxidoreductase family membrane subunit
MHQPTEDEALLLAPLTRTSRGFMVLVGLLATVAMVGVIAYVRQLSTGLGVTGMNRPVYWGVYIVNFVFFIGLAHSGTFISAILRLVGAGWRTPLARAAEAITVFSVPFGAGSILIDLGRIDRMFNVFMYGRFASALLWDVTSVSLYLLSSIVFFYLALLPDLARCRDQLTGVPHWQHEMYRILSLGWQDHPEQYRRLEKVLDGMAVFMSLLVVTVHTVVAWVFSMTLQPGWHTAILGPFFLVGAVFSGSGAVVVAMAVLRRVFHLENILTRKHFNYMRQLLIALTLVWLYFLAAEYLTTFYGQEIPEMHVFLQKFTGGYTIPHLAMFALCFVIPFPILLTVGKKSIRWMVTAGLMINAGMWLERYVVVLPTLTRPHLLNELAMGTYRPTVTEWAMTAACFAGLLLLYALFTRFFPIVPIWERSEEVEAYLHEEGRIAPGE